VKYFISQASRVGGRKNNQDRIGYAHAGNALLFAVADGMGGHQRGEVAAEIAVQTLIDAFKGQESGHFPDPSDFLQQSIYRSHQGIIDYAQTHEMPEPPGTTCIVCLLQDDAVWWAHAGDSRLYHFRGIRLLTKTRDHSLVEKMVENGSLTAEAALTHPSKNIIYNCLGAVGSPEVEVSIKTELRAGDALLLCSDGLWGPLSDDELATGANRAAPDAALKALMDLAEARTGKTSDNLSGILIHCGENTDKTLAPVG